MYITQYIPRHLPEPLAGLAELALDMRWSWSHASDNLWRTIDQELWDATGNPWYILGIPLTGVGLLYQQGYFRQVIDRNGNQTEFYPYNDPAINRMLR